MQPRWDETYKIFIGKTAWEGKWDGSRKSLGESSDHNADLIAAKEKEKEVLGCSAASARLTGAP